MTTATPPSLNNFWQAFYAKNATIISLDTTATGDFYPLHDWALLVIDGPDASAFLQGQLTADIEAMQAGDAVFTAHCDAKGRMHANAVLYCQSATRYLLQMPAANLEIATKALAKYAVFSKVELSDAPDLVGFAGKLETRHADAKKLASSVTINMPCSGLCVHWIDLNANPAESLLEQSLSFLSNNAWQAALIEAGIAFVRPITSGEFIPQMFNLDAIEGISFTKGCYTGQEIIARMKYLGQVKRRCYQFSTSSHSLPANFDATHLIGKNIVDSAHKTAGTVVAAAIGTEGLTGLAVIKMAVLNAKLELSLNDDSCDASLLPLKLTSPPYALDQG